MNNPIEAALRNVVKNLAMNSPLTGSDIDSIFNQSLGYYCARMARAMDNEESTMSVYEETLVFINREIDERWRQVNAKNLAASL